MRAEWGRSGGREPGPLSRLSGRCATPIGVLVSILRALRAAHGRNPRLPHWPRKPGRGNRMLVQTAGDTGRKSDSDAVLCKFEETPYLPSPRLYNGQARFLYRAGRLISSDATILWRCRMEIQRVRRDRYEPDQRQIRCVAGGCRQRVVPARAGNSLLHRKPVNGHRSSGTFRRRIT